MPVPDLVLGRIVVLVEQTDGRHDHPGRAEAALQAVALPEPLLDRMKIAVLGQALDRGDGGSLGLDRQHRARLGADTVHQNRAGTAITALTTDVGTGQIEVLPKEMDQERSCIHVAADASPVDRH